MFIVIVISYQLSKEEQVQLFFQLYFGCIMNETTFCNSSLFLNCILILIKWIRSNNVVKAKLINALFNFLDKDYSSKILGFIVLLSYITDIKAVSWHSSRQLKKRVEFRAFHNEYFKIIWEINTEKEMLFQVRQNLRNFKCVVCAAEK